MKRIFKIIALETALILLSTCIGFFSACSPKPKNIVATAMFSKNVLELPILGTVPGAPKRYSIN